MIFRRAAELSAVALCCAIATACADERAPDYRPAYVYAQRCFAVATVVKDDAGARRAFDAAI
jgi:hypothetical protein